MTNKRIITFLEYLLTRVEELEEAANFDGGGKNTATSSSLQTFIDDLKDDEGEPDEPREKKSFQSFIEELKRISPEELEKRLKESKPIVGEKIDDLEKGKKNNG